MAFPSLVELQQQRQHKASCLADLIEKSEKENRVLTAEERTIFDGIEKDLGELDAKIVEVSEHVQRHDKLNTLKQKYADGPGRITTPDPIGKQGGNDDKVFATPLKRSGTLKSFKGANAEQTAYRCGKWIRAAIFRDWRAAEWCRANGMYDSAISNALGTSPNTAGGFLVPEEFSQAIIDLRESYGVYRKNCQVVPMGRDTMTIPRRSGGVTIAAVGENPSSAIGQSNPTWNQVRLTAKKAGGLTLMSTEVSDESVIDLADWLANEYAYAFSLFEDQCGWIGDGTSTYLGILGWKNILIPANSYVGAVDAASGHDTMAEIDGNDLQAVMGKLPEYARAGAKWYCSTVALDLIFGRLMAAAGGNTIQNMMGGYGPSYMGYPIVISQVLPTSVSTINDTPILYFGNLAMASTMGDRRDVTIFPSEHRYMDTDQIGIRATARFDIVNHDFGDTSNAGPLVALVGNT